MDEYGLFKHEEEIPISPEELRKEMYHDLVQKNIITEKDLKKKVVKEPEVDKFVKVSSYLLENHSNLFELFTINGAYYEAVKIARRFVEDEIIKQHEKKYRSTPYYFEKDDTKIMKSIDDAISNGVVIEKPVGRPIVY